MNTANIINDVWNKIMAIINAIRLSIIFKGSGHIFKTSF